MNRAAEERGRPRGANGVGRLFNGGDALWRYAEAHSPLAPPEVGRASAR